MRVIALSAFALLISASAFAGSDGAATYKAKCASCHSADGSGQSAIGIKMILRDLGSADVQKQSDDELYKLIADGKKKMPAYKAKLSEADIKSLVAFVRTLAKK